jgi:hypothetical protein
MFPHCALTVVRRLALSFVLAVGGTAPMSAQSAEPGARASMLHPHAAHALWVRRPAAQAGTREHEPLGGLLGPDDQDYRYPGFFVGAGVGLAAVALAVAWCGDAEGGCDYGRVVLFGPLGVAAVGFAGAVVGGLFPKHPTPPVAPES